MKSVQKGLILLNQGFGKHLKSPKVDLVVQTCYYNLNVRVFFSIIEQPRADNACEN